MNASVSGAVPVVVADASIPTWTEDRAAPVTAEPVHPLPGLAALAAGVGAATAVQLAGALLIAVGAGLATGNLGVGILAAGVVVLLMGVALELGRSRAR